MSSPDARARSLALHTERWGAPDRVVRAPGRVNLIGEHTDYNDGFTLPMALPFDTVVTMSDVAGDAPGDETAVTVVSDGFGEVTFSADDTPDDIAPWAVHLLGAVQLLTGEGIDAGGWRAAIATDIPTGASLSSSAALEVAVITAVLDRAGITWTPLEVARLGQRIENEVVGLPSGIMDQFISAGAVAGHASLMDCRALTLTPAPLSADARVAVLDTGTRRVLAEAAYADRRASCEAAVAELGIDSLRDASLDQVAGLADPETRRRATHIVTEIARTAEAADAMAAGDVERFGELMTASHVSLRDDYEVSGPGLDAMVDAALAAPGCLGARMTGGGFAGAAVALVAVDQVDAFTEAVDAAYRFDGHRARIWICEPAAGAEVVSGGGAS